jgi:hypothetical protein
VAQLNTVFGSRLRTMDEFESHPKNNGTPAVVGGRRKWANIPLVTTPGHDADGHPITRELSDFSHGIASMLEK